MKIHKTNKGDFFDSRPVIGICNTWSEQPDLVAERGYVNLYVQHVQQADKDADLDFLVGKSGSRGYTGFSLINTSRR